MANGPYYAEGDYTATIISHTFAPGEYGVQLVIGIEPNVEAQMYPRTIYLPFLDKDENPDKNYERTIAALNHIGYADNPSRLDKDSDNPASLVGNEIDVVCKYSNAGKERWFIKTPREEREPVGKAMLRKLDSLFGKELKKGAAAQVKTPEPSKQSFTADARKVVEEAKSKMATKKAESTEPVTEEGDDIPF